MYLGLWPNRFRECSHIIRIGRELTIAFAERILYAYEGVWATTRKAISDSVHQEDVVCIWVVTQLV